MAATATSIPSYFDDFPLKLQNAAQIDSAGEQESTEVLSATPTLKRKKTASSEQRKKTNVSYFFICVLCDRADAFLTFPWLHVWWSISLLQVGEVPHFPLVPRFHVNSSFVAISSTRTHLLCTLILARVACVLELSRHTTMITKNGAVCTDNSKATIYWIESSRTSKGLKRFVRSWF